jgi:hypothetical protein
MSLNIREQIAGAIAAMPVVDHHEHAWRPFSARDAQEIDLPFFLYTGYLGGDLMAAGCPAQAALFDYLQDPKLPDGADHAWQTIRPFVERVRNTSYYRYVLRGLEELFGISEHDLFSDRWREASDRIRRHSRENKGDGPSLLSRMRVTAMVLDAKLPANRLQEVSLSDPRVLHVARLDMFIHEERGLADTLAEHRPADLDEWLAVFGNAFQAYLHAGAAGFKTGLAYNRRIAYADPSKDEVHRIFKGGLLGASQAERTAYQDFMVDRLCQLCVEADVPLQIHTGIQAGIRHVLEDTRPTLLTDLFRRHPDLRVDLFHGGYPWCIQAGLMAKYFPNVYIDGCWLHHISPSAYRAALTSWIEIVPMSKIFAWGGDHTATLAHSYASLVLAKDLIADVLADLVQRSYFDLEFALLLARRILHDNGIEFWRVDARQDAGRDDRSRMEP